MHRMIDVSIEKLFLIRGKNLEVYLSQFFYGDIANFDEGNFKSLIWSDYNYGPSFFIWARNFLLLRFWIFMRILLSSHSPFDNFFYNSALKFMFFFLIIYYFDPSDIFAFFTVLPVTTALAFSISANCIIIPLPQYLSLLTSFLHLLTVVFFPVLCHFFLFPPSLFLSTVQFISVNFCSFHSSFIRVNSLIAACDILFDESFGIR